MESLFAGELVDIVNERGVLPGKVEMTPETLLAAYGKGIFPYNTDDSTGLVEWVSKPDRGVLNFVPVEDEPLLRVADNLGRRFNREVLGVKFEQKIMRVDGKNQNIVYPVIAFQPIYTITFDKAFGEVMLGCRQMERAETKTSWIKDTPIVGPNDEWIRDEFIDNYSKLFEMGYGHSVEVWEGDKLVGGIYGVLSHGYFSAESAFRTKEYVSQYAMIALTQKLKSLGFTWMDTQIVTNMTKEFGARTISRDRFQERLKLARATKHLPWGTPFELVPIQK
jgi:leucyl/phenylalanyl-tRNA--protein transferase